jgi:transposase
VLCIRKCLQFGLNAALRELPRRGKPRQLPEGAIAWVLPCACQKPKELGYSCELWTYKLLTAHMHRHCIAAGHPALQKLSRSKLHKILHQGELRPHKTRYYVERRDPAFEARMAIVLHVYKEVEIVNEYRRREPGQSPGMVTISYDEKLGIQALAVTTPDRRPGCTARCAYARIYRDAVAPATNPLLSGSILLTIMSLLIMRGCIEGILCERAPRSRSTCTLTSCRHVQDSAAERVEALLIRRRRKK